MFSWELIEKGSPWALLLAALAWSADRVIRWRKDRGAEEGEQSSVRLEVEKHRDKMLLDLIQLTQTKLQASEQEISQLTSELRKSRLEPGHAARAARNIRMLSQALDHIRALLLADGTGDREAVEFSARQFLARAELMVEAEGLAGNAAQRRAAKRKLEQKKGLKP